MQPRETLKHGRFIQTNPVFFGSNCVFVAPETHQTTVTLEFLEDLDSPWINSSKILTSRSLEWPIKSLQNPNISNISNPLGSTRPGTKAKMPKIDTPDRWVKKSPRRWEDVPPDSAHSATSPEISRSTSPRKLQHTPGAHPRQSPYPTMKGFPLQPIGKGLGVCSKGVLKQP